MTTNTPDTLPNSLEYVGFGPRLMAMISDILLISAFSYPLLYLMYGATFQSMDDMPDTILEAALFSRGPGEVLVNWVFPTVYYIALWRLICATPGKYFVRIAVVDADTGKRASLIQYIIRYFSYIISALPLFLGYFAILWDDRKQAWHDRLSGTVVVANVERKTRF